MAGVLHARTANALPNPTNDAKLIADALRQDGFGVTVTDNLDHEGFIKALRTFASEADSADWAVVYFAGHGIESPLPSVPLRRNRGSVQDLMRRSAEPISYAGPR
jgi:uncharacterized caspase-like protein